MKWVPKRFKGEVTEAQAKGMRETRDCPDTACDGHLDRIDVWTVDDVVHEKYEHVGTDDHEECDCAGGKKGLLGSSVGDIVVSHYESGKRKGHGCLSGEL